MYVMVIFSIMKFTPIYLYTFYSVILSIIVYSIYILIINTQFMDRKLVYKAD